MDQDQLNTHYKRLATTYNQSFTSSTDGGKKGYTFLGEEGAKIYQDLLKLRSSEKLVDLGAGTCVTAGNRLNGSLFYGLYRVTGLLSSNLPLTWIWDVPPSCPGSR